MRQRSIEVIHQSDNGYGDKLIINNGKFVEVQADGGTTVYGSFTPNEVAALVKAAFLLGKGESP